MLGHIPYPKFGNTWSLAYCRIIGVSDSRVCSTLSMSCHLARTNLVSASTAELSSASKSLTWPSRSRACLQTSWHRWKIVAAAAVQSTLGYLGWSFRCRKDLSIHSKVPGWVCLTKPKNQRILRFRVLATRQVLQFATLNGPFVLVTFAIVLPNPPDAIPTSYTRMRTNH